VPEVMPTVHIAQIISPQHGEIREREHLGLRLRHSIDALGMPLCDCI